MKKQMRFISVGVNSEGEGNQISAPPNAPSSVTAPRAPPSPLPYPTGPTPRRSSEGVTPANRGGLRDDPFGGSDAAEKTLRAPLPVEIFLVSHPSDRFYFHAKHPCTGCRGRKLALMYSSPPRLLAKRGAHKPGPATWRVR